MIRAGSSAEQDGVEAPPESGDLGSHHQAEERPTVGTEVPAGGSEDAHTAEDMNRPMHPDSARFQPQPGAAQPANTAGGAITCPECGMENVAAGGRRFCGQCGGNLWERCHACGADVPVDEGFCGQCGVNMAESVQKQVQAVEEQLTRALQLEKDYRFSEAAVLLTSISKSEHPRLKKFREIAHQRLQHVRFEHERWQHLADAAHNKAREALSLCEFDVAIRLLEEIPSPLRTTPMETMLLDVRARNEEVEQLTGQLRVLVTEKRGGDALPVIERLQRLQPNHALARKVALRMRDQLVAKAEAKIAARRYDDALELLRRVPSSAKTTATEKLLKNTDELSALHWAAHHGQYVDRALKEVLTRIVRLLPKDESIAKLVTEYRKRRQRLDAPERTVPVPWANTTKTPWNCPVQWMVSPERIGMDAIATDVRRDCPGAFAAAFGLALQGIGKGPVRIDFNDAESGVLGRMSRLMREKRHTSAWGIDIGDHSLKAVKLRAMDGGQRVEAVVCECIPHRKLLSQAANYGEARDLVEESFDRIRGQHSLKGERLCLSLPGRLTICRTLHLPPVGDRKIESVIRYEARHVLPGDLDDYRWRSYAPESGYEVTKDGPSHRLLLAHTRRHIAFTEETFERLNIQPDVLQCEYLALHNYLGFELSTEHGNGDGKRGATVLLDMGSNGTNMIVHSSDYLWGRYLGVGGYSFSRAIVREFQLTLHQADQWKRDPSPVDRWSRWETTLGAVFESLGKELRSALEAFAKDHPGERIERILAVGGAIQLHGLMRYLRTGR